MSNALSKEEGIPKDTLRLPSSKASEHYKRSDDKDTKHIMTKMDSTYRPRDGKDKEEEINVMPLVDSVHKSNRIKNPLSVKWNDFFMVSLNHNNDNNCNVNFPQSTADMKYSQINSYKTNAKIIILNF